MAAHSVNVTELTKASPPDFDWRAIQQALLDIGGPSPAEKAGDPVNRSIHEDCEEGLEALSH